jgi:hypothetical protein
MDSAQNSQHESLNISFDATAMEYSIALGTEPLLENYQAVKQYFMHL